MVCEKDVIAFTRAAPGGPPALAIASRLPRFQQFYTLCVTPRCEPWLRGAGGACVRARVWWETPHGGQAELACQQPQRALREGAPPLSERGPGCRCRGARAASRGGGAQSLSRSVGEYFHEDGQLAAGVIKKDAVELLRKATEGKTK